MDPRALAHGRSGPDTAVFNAGFERFSRMHREWSNDALTAPQRLLGLGTRLWREGQRDRRIDGDDAGATLPLGGWTADVVKRALEVLTLRAALARRRATWLTRMVDTTIVWREPGEHDTRLLIVENGDIRVDVALTMTPPVPPGSSRSVGARHQRLTIVRFDRLRVLTTELKRLGADRAFVAVRFGPGPEFSGRRLARALWWL
jgi:hypothetical protein